MADGHYSKLYHVLADEYPAVYDDDRALGCYARLLMAADAAWPLRPYLPSMTNRRTLGVLVGTGLVICDRGRYTVLGLDAERSKRRANATAGGKARAQQLLSGSLSSGLADAEPSKAKQSKAEGVRGVRPLDARDPDAPVDPER